MMQSKSIVFALAMLFALLAPARAQQCKPDIGDLVFLMQDAGGDLIGFFDVPGGYGFEDETAYYYDQIVIFRTGEQLKGGKSFRGCPVGIAVEIGKAGEVSDL